MSTRRRRARLASRVLLAAVVALSGCRTTAARVAGFLNWGSATFAPNPVASVPFHAGVVVGFVVGLPLCLLSWPLAALFYPEEDEDEFYLSAALGPSIVVGTLLGTLLATPVAPFGMPFVPDEPPPPPGPAPASADGAPASADGAPATGDGGEEGR